MNHKLTALLAALSLSGCAGVPYDPQFAQAMNILADGVRNVGAVQQEIPRTCFGCPVPQYSERVSIVPNTNQVRIDGSDGRTRVCSPVPNRSGEVSCR